MGEDTKINGKIYIATNKTTGRHYIGQTIKKFEHRKNQHICRSKNSKYGFGKAILKYGPENFEWNILEMNIDNHQLLNEREIYWIKTYNSFHNGYNHTRGGQGYPNRVKFGCQVELNGVKYISQTAAASDLGVSISAISYWKKMGYTHKPTKCEIRKRRYINRPDFFGGKNPRARPIKINGVEYDCITQAANVLGVQRSTIRKWLNGNDSCEHGEKRSLKRKIVLDGIKFDSLRSAGQYHNVRYNEIWKWIKNGRGYYEI